MFQIAASGFKCRNYLGLVVFLLQVLIPIKEYTGQKLIKPVIRHTIDKTMRAKPKEPSIIFEK